MSVSLDALYDFFQQLLGMDPFKTEDEDGIAFLYYKGDACAHVGVYPTEVQTQAGYIDSAELIFTFCQSNGEPYNLKQFSEENSIRIINALLPECVWGMLEMQEASDDLAVLVHYRNILLRLEDLEPVDDDYQLSNLSARIGIMHDEWLKLNNLLTIICLVSTDITQDHVQLLLAPYEGHA
jgi:hypothetical protein